MPLLLHQRFSRFAHLASETLGSVWTFIVTITIIGLWVLGGFFLGFTDTYQLIINTISTLVTSIYVVIIQHTQTRHATAMHAKIDELIRAIDEADNRLIGLEKPPPPVQ